MQFYIILFFQSLRLCHLAPSIWLEISINWHTKSQGPKKKCTLFQDGGSTLAPPTLLLIRVVLLHTDWFVKFFNSPTVQCIYILGLPLQIRGKILKVYFIDEYCYFTETLAPFLVAMEETFIFCIFFPLQKWGKN